MEKIQLKVVILFVVNRKSVAVPYIIALIIGVIVVAVLAYWFISSGSKGTKIGTEAECTARKVEYCATQTQDVLTKVQQVCKDGNDWKPVCFCTNIIPNWKSINDPGADKKKC